MLWEYVATYECYWPMAVEKLRSSESQTEPVRPNMPLRAPRTYLYSLQPYNHCSDLMRWERIGETWSLLQTTSGLRLYTRIRANTFIFKQCEVQRMSTDDPQRCFGSNMYFTYIRLNKTPTWCNKMQILLLQTFSACFGRHAPIIRSINYWHGSHRYW